MVETSLQQYTDKPIADILLGTEKLAAFTECWKEIIGYFQRGSVADDFNLNLISVLSKFFGVNLNFYTKKNQHFEL